MSSCRMTSFVVRSAKRFHQVLAADAVEVREMVVVPDAHLVRFHLLRRFVHRVGRRLQEIRRLVDIRRERPDDQVLVANRLVELDGGRELVTLKFAEGVMESARLELDRVEVFPPFRARLTERVLEFDAVEPGGRERAERARECRWRAACARTRAACRPGMRFQAASANAGSAGSTRAEAAAVPPSLRMSRRVGCVCMECVLSIARILRSTSRLGQAGGRRNRRRRA